MRSFESGFHLLTGSSSSVSLGGPVLLIKLCSSRNDPVNGLICRTKDQCKNKPCKDYRVRFSCFPPYCGSSKPALLLARSRAYSPIWTAPLSSSAVCWTKWFDLDNPSGTGDWELLINLQSAFPGQIPNSPDYIQAVTTNNNVPALKTGQAFHK